MWFGENAKVGTADVTQMCMTTCVICLSVSNYCLRAIAGFCNMHNSMVIRAEKKNLRCISSLSLNNSASMNRFPCFFLLFLLFILPVHVMSHIIAAILRNEYVTDYINVILSFIYNEN